MPETPSPFPPHPSHFSDTSEKGLESLIVASMTGQQTGTASQDEIVREALISFAGTSWITGDPKDYDREYAVDLTQLSAFLKATQPKALEALDLANPRPTRQKFLARLQGEI